MVGRGKGMRGRGLVVLPEADLFDPMFLPDAQGVVLEAGEEIGHAAGDGGVDAEFVDHDCCWLCSVVQ